MQQNSVKFGAHFTRARKKFTPALLASWNVFPSLGGGGIEGGGREADSQRVVGKQASANQMIMMHADSAP